MYHCMFCIYERRLYVAIFDFEGEQKPADQNGPVIPSPIR